MSCVFDYYYGEESESCSFYRIPRLLIVGERFSGLSTDAKLLYGLMLDRMNLSARNGWYDDAGRVYIYYTLEEMDNRYALLFIRGERPVMDEKYDILRHPNLSRTEDGGAAPYVHKLADYACADMSAAFVSLEELILLEGFTE